VVALGVEPLTLGHEVRETALLQRGARPWHGARRTGAIVRMWRVHAV
jgi:hypothetical protein